MSSDRSTHLGLDVDTPPDRLGDRAFRLKNVVPGSSVSVRPRPGVSKSASYLTGVLGRSIVVDGLQDALGEGVALICTNETDAGAGDGTTNDQVDAVFVFKPSVVGATLDTVDGVNKNALLYGMIQ